MLQICSNQHGDDGHHQELRGIWPGSLCRFERKSLGAIFRPRIPLGEGAVCFSFVISLNSDKSLTHAFHSNRFFFALICKILLIFRSCHLCFSFSCKYSFWFLLHCDRYNRTISWIFPDSRRSALGRFPRCFLWPLPSPTHAAAAGGKVHDGDISSGEFINWETPSKTHTHRKIRNYKMSMPAEILWKHRLSILPRLHKCLREQNVFVKDNNREFPSLSCLKVFVFPSFVR